MFPNTPAIPYPHTATATAPPCLETSCRAATDALERCRAHAEKAADRTSAAVDLWLAERRRRWEAGRTRCEELAPPVGGTLGGGGAATDGAAPNDAFDSGEDMVPSSTVGIDCSGEGVGRPKWLESAGANGFGRGRQRQVPRGVWESPWESSWDWGKGGREGVSFEDFFETFAGGVEEIGLDPTP